jgi:general secretion pathway protein G
MRRARGFTLIELLVVMAIIATLLTIALPRYFRSLEQAREATLRQDLSVMRDSIDKYFGDLGRYPEKLTDLVQNQYLRAVPVDPFTRTAASWVAVPSEDAELSGLRDVQSGAEGVSLGGMPYSTF